jgi:prevent-host-death family protein
MVKSVYGQRINEYRKQRVPLRAADGQLSYRVGSRAFQTAEDIIPIAELKANMSEIVRGLDERPRPLVVTLNGKPAAVVMSPREYDLLSYQSRFVEAVNEGLADTAAGRTYDGDQVVDELMSELKARKPRKARAR